MSKSTEYELYSTSSEDFGFRDFERGMIEAVEREISDLKTHANEKISKLKKRAKQKISGIQKQADEIQKQADEGCEQIQRNLDDKLALIDDKFEKYMDLFCMYQNNIERKFQAEKTEKETIRQNLETVKHSIDQAITKLAGSAQKSPSTDVSQLGKPAMHSTPKRKNAIVSRIPVGPYTRKQLAHVGPRKLALRNAEITNPAFCTI